MEINEVVEKQMISRMKIDNPWWSNGTIREDFKALAPRAYLESFYAMVSNMGVKRAFILMGPRRVGKTVMLYHSIQRFIDDGISPQNLIYLSVETPIYNNIPLEQLMHTAFKAIGKAFSLEEWYYVFFDEVQSERLGNPSQVIGRCLSQHQVCGFGQRGGGIEKEQHRKRCRAFHRFPSAPAVVLRIPSFAQAGAFD